MRGGMSMRGGWVGGWVDGVWDGVLDGVWDGWVGGWMGFGMCGMCGDDLSVTSIESGSISTT